MRFLQVNKYFIRTVIFIEMSINYNNNKNNDSVETYEIRLFRKYHTIKKRSCFTLLEY